MTGQQIILLYHANAAQNNQQTNYINDDGLNRIQTHFATFLF